MTEREQHTHSNDEISLIEIIEVLWKNKWLIIVLPVLFAVLALVVSQFLTPSYTSHAKIYLGNFTNEMYTSPENAREVILSNDLLEEVIDDLSLSYELPRDLRKEVSVETLSETSMIEVSVSNEDAERAQQITANIVERFLERSTPAHEERHNLIHDIYEKTKAVYENTIESLERNKEALTKLEENTELSEAERDLTRGRLIDYIEMDETQLLTLTQQLQDQQLQLQDINGPETFEQATLPRAPESPRPILNAAIAFVVGAMLAVAVAFVREYFLHHFKRRDNNLSQEK